MTSISSLAALRPVPTSDVTVHQYALSPLQEGMLFHWRLDGHSGTDIEPLQAAVHPKALIGYKCDSQRYFDIHHTAADTFDKVNRRELELGGAGMAGLIYLLSKYGL